MSNFQNLAIIVADTFGFGFAYHGRRYVILGNPDLVFLPVLGGRSVTRKHLLLFGEVKGTYIYIFPLIRA
jgi:hypothetical protein